MSTLDRIYAIVHQSRKQAYVGRTFMTLEARWQRHLLAAARGEEKLLFEELRHAPQEWDILECEHSETASEAEWIAKFEADGYSMLNEVGGNRKAPKRRDTAHEAEVKAVLEGVVQPKLPSEEEKAVFRAYMKKQRDEWAARTTKQV